MAESKYESFSRQLRQARRRSAGRTIAQEYRLDDWYPGSCYESNSADPSEKEYEFDDPKQAFAEAESRIQQALEKGSKELDLSGLGLEAIPASIGQLIRLRGLFCEGNRLETIPESIGNLVDLSALFLSYNRLSGLPSALRKLNELRDLRLAYNRLTALPTWVRSFGLEFLSLHGNAGLGLPPEILGSEYSSNNEASPSDILDYYFRTQHEKRSLNEAKLILLGRGEAGKTCLVNRLLHDKFVSTCITHGIEISQWLVTKGKETVRMHVWDFGGQEIQHTTHQFFLTERSLYLVVLNGRAGGEDDDAEYWLKFVKTFGAGSSTIVVLNKFKVQPFQVNRRALQQKYPFIHAFVETDCEPSSANGIPELRKQIASALADMEHVRADFPAGWFQIKERLAEMKEPFISFAEYRKICTELGEADPHAQEQLAGFLNALGIALNFREDPQLREETVLNPHWITEGVYQVITSKALAERQGELRLADLARILPKKDYPVRMHGFLIELMRKFELCFSYHDDPSEHRYLVPELLGKEEPVLKEPFPPGECLNIRYDYRLMPEGLLPRFITRTHMLSQTSERWRTGVVLRWEGSRALVKADKQERQVLVRVLGEPEKRRRLLAVIRENFDQIHAEMKEFKPAEWVALENHPEDWVSFRELEGFEQRQIKEMAKLAGTDVVTVNVTDVLDETDVPGARKRGDGTVVKRQPSKLFISYAHEDEKWRAKLAPNLALLEREGLVQVWCDSQIKPGDKWDDEIRRKLEDAEVYLFLMSTSLLASKYVQETELPIAKRRHQANQARLVPVVVRECTWNSDAYFKAFQVSPKGGRPIAQWTHKDKAFHDVELNLRKTVAEVRQILDKS